MARGRRGFRRHAGERLYKKLFIIASEGAKTEPEYFEIFNRLDNLDKTVLVKCLKDKHHNAPKQVLKRMGDYIRDQ